VDEQIFFNSLTKEDIEKIIDIELRELRERAEESGYKLTITPSAKKFIAEAGYDPAFGARPLKRAVMRYVEDPVSEFIISDRILQGKRKKGSTELRTLKVGLTPEKDNTLVSLKED
jgi:ATP-dependent Clp protease ATP-binding subunit ClpC